MLKVAFPAPSAPAPSVVVPSRKVTVPVIGPALPEETVAVKVTLAPGAEGLCEEARFVDVDAFTTAFTVWDSGVAVELALKFVSPAYVAVML